MDELTLHIPNENELDYRRFLIADEDTMSYNAGCGENGGSVYHLTAEQNLKWWKYWKSEGNFYAYVVRVADSAYVGEVNIHFSAEVGYPREGGIGWIGVLIEYKFRGRGYGASALRLLVKYAFQTLLLNELLDDIPSDREDALHVFEQAGFIRDTEMGVMKLSRTEGIPSK